MLLVLRTFYPVGLKQTTGAAIIPSWQITIPPGWLSGKPPPKISEKPGKELSADLLQSQRWGSRISLSSGLKCRQLPNDE
jgi:hypothetical protein